MRKNSLAKRVLAGFFALCLTLFVSIGMAGCTRGKYSFVGIIGPDHVTVLKLDEIEDETERQALEVFGYSKSEIRLMGKSRFEWKFVTGSERFSETTITSGEYTIEGDKIIFTYSSTGKAEDALTSTCDFVDGGIVVYTNGFFLVYRK